MFEELYNTESGKYEYINYRAQDFFLNDNSEYINFKDKAGTLNIIKSKVNTLNCVSGGHHFVKKIIGIRRSRNKNLNGLCYEIENNYLYNFNRLLIEELLDRRVNCLELPVDYKRYVNPLEAEYSGDYAKIFANKDKEEIKNRNKKLNAGKLQKIDISSSFSDLMDSFEIVTDYLSREYKNLPEFRHPYSILYILQLISRKNKDYLTRPDLTEIKQTGIITVNEIWNKYKIPEQYSYKEFLYLINKIKKFNDEEFRKTGLNFFTDQIAWNYVKRLCFDKSDSLFMQKIQKFNEIRNSSWATLDRMTSIKTNIVILSTKKTEEYLRLKSLLNLVDQKEILYDTIKKEFIIPIKFKEKTFGNTLEYLNNVILKYNLEINCSNLYFDTTVANINNKTVKVISSDDFTASETPKKEVISKEYSNYILDHLANPFKFKKPEIFENISFPLHISMEVKENPYHLGYTKYKLDLRQDLEISAIESSGEISNELYGIDFIDYQDNKYLGKAISKEYDLINKINNRLIKTGKSKLQKTIPYDLLHEVIGNFIKASLDISIYKYNNIEKDRYDKRDRQTYYIASNVRSKIIQESINRYIANSEISKFKSKENFLAAIKSLTKYDTALAIYKTISEDIFKLNKTDFDGSYSRADICLSYDLDLNKITKVLSKFVQVKKFFGRLKKEKDLVKEEIRGISLKELKNLVRTVNQSSYINGDPNLQIKVLAIRHFFSIFVGLIFEVKKKTISWVEVAEEILNEQKELKSFLLKIPLKT